MSDISFSQRLQNGATKEQLKTYYVMNDREYSRVIASNSRYGCKRMQ